MSLKVVCDGKKVLGGAAVAQLFLSLQKEYTLVDELWNKHRRAVHIIAAQRLPDITRFPGLFLESVTTRGDLNMDGAWIHTCREVLERGRTLLSTYGGLNVTWIYTEKCSKQRNGGDSIGLKLEGEKSFLRYGANGSLVCVDRDYRRRVMADLIRRFNLPLAVKVVKGKDFLRHTSSGIVTITNSAPGGGDPHAFLCELPTVQYSDCLKKIDDFLNEYASKRLELSWALFSDSEIENKSEVTMALYDALRKNPLPAQSYDISIVLFLRSLDGIDQLSSLLKDQYEEALIELCKFSGPEKSRYCLELLIGDDGARLRVCSNQKADKSQFRSTVLGRKLKEFL